MKLLYLSCHAILEYDEVKLFNELGLDWFSLGSYINPEAPVDPIRPFISHRVNTNWLAQAPLREEMPQSFINQFDIIVIMHVPEWIEKNWDRMKHKRVIWRTIGQSTSSVEQRMSVFRNEGLQVLRYSPREVNIPNFIGGDGMIRFYKESEEFDLYNGVSDEVITFAQNMIHRGEYCHFNLFQQITEGLNAKVYGPKNEEAGNLNGGFLSYKEMQQKMRDSRVYIYTGTQPASYTLNFIEAWMTGIPVVAIGPKLWNSLNIAGDVYEIGDLIENGINGFVSDDIEFLKHITKRLVDDPQLAKQIGMEGRKKAIALFGKDVIKSEWGKFLGM